MTPLDMIRTGQIDVADWEEPAREWYNQARDLVVKDLLVSFEGVLELDPGRIEFPPFEQTALALGVRVPVQWVMNGVQNSPLHDIPPDARLEVKLEGISIVVAVDGELNADTAQFERYTDWLSFYQQLGVGLAPRSVGIPTEAP